LLSFLKYQKSTVLQRYNYISEISKYLCVFNYHNVATMWLLGNIGNWNQITAKWNQITEN